MKEADKRRADLVSAAQYGDQEAHPELKTFLRETLQTWMLA